MTKKKLKYVFAMSAVLALISSCSSSDKSDDSEDALSEDEIPLADAGTDTVPEDSVDELKDYVPEDKLENTFDDLAQKQEEEPTLEAPPAATTTEDTSASMMETTPSTSNNDMASSFTSSGEEGSYTVQKGDTLMKIAFEIYGDVFQWRKIQQMNSDKVTDPNMISSGVVLKVEKPVSPVNISRNGDRYLIKQGDTLGTISQDVYGTPKNWKRIYENNPELIKDPNRIFAGFYVYYTFTPEDQQQKDSFGEAPRMPASTNSMNTVSPTTNVGSSPGMIQNSAVTAPKDDMMNGSPEVDLAQ